MCRRDLLFAVAAAVLVCATPAHAAAPAVEEYPVPEGSHPHDVAPARNGGVW